MRRAALVLVPLAALLAWAVLRRSEPARRAAPPPTPAADPAPGPKAALRPPAEAAPRATPDRTGVEEDTNATSEEEGPFADLPPLSEWSDPRLRGPHCTARVTVLDAGTGLPVPGVMVKLDPVFDPAEPLAPWSGGHTDERGTFEVELKPGEYLAMHRPVHGDGPHSLALELTPSRFEVDCRRAPVELVLTARRPLGELEVEVTYPDGRPVLNARVIFTCRMDDAPLVDPENMTDARGRVRISVWDTLHFSDGRLTAQNDTGWVSDVVSIETPLVPGLRRLVLQPGAALNVTVREADGKPVAGRRLLLAANAANGWRQDETTDDDGRARFAALFAGAYTLVIHVPELDTWDRRPVELARGERRDFEIVLEPPAEAVAASGRVLDEEGAPLAGVPLAIEFDGLEAGFARTDSDGAFAFRGRSPAARVRVGAGVVQQGDRFDPPAIEAAFGAQDLLFRRTARATLRTFEVEVVDAVTGEEVEHFVATIDRGPGTEAWSDSYAPRRRFSLRLLPDARWSVKSHGYVTRELDLWTALEALGPDERLRVELEPGLDHAFQVLDADTLDPVAGALFRSPTAGEARTDAGGRVRLRADHWSAYRVTKDGYEPADWDPDSDLLWGGGRPYWLVRSD